MNNKTVTVSREEKLRAWLLDRKSISIRKLENEAGMPYTSIAQFMGQKPKDFAEKHWEKLIPVLEKYGWKE